MKDLSLLFQKSKNFYVKQLKKKYPDPEVFLSGKMPVLIFGAGRMGRVFLSNLQKKGISVVAFVDNNAAFHNTKINGVPVISFNELKKNYFEYPILIASLLYETPIYEKLIEEKFKNVFPLVYLNYLDPRTFVSPEYESTFTSLLKKKNQEKLLEVYNLLEDAESKRVLYDIVAFRLTTEKKYIQDAQSEISSFFAENVFPITSEEVFVDCGGYDGDSIKLFLTFVKHKFKKVYSFEPDKYNFKILKNWIKEFHNENIIPVQLGVLNKAGDISFSESGSVDSRIITTDNFISSKGEKSEKINTISVVTIDEYFKDKEIPTWIKMDIEGVETEALLGAKKIIKKYKPKLAISIYHHSSDLWKLPLLIKKLNKDYKFYIRHHTSEHPDTMCYAI